MVYSADIHVDHNTHELVVEEHGHHESGLVHVATEGGVGDRVDEKAVVQAVERV